MIIRGATQDDLPGLRAFVKDTGLFQLDQLQQVDVMLGSFVAGEGQPGEQSIVDDREGLVGLAYYAPERITQGTRSLCLIGIQPTRQGRGLGKALLRHLEQTLATQGGRVLIVETSAHDRFEDTRAFYERCGYTQEARIRDFYAGGDNKIVFWKALSPS